MEALTNWSVSPRSLSSESVCHLQINGSCPACQPGWQTLSWKKWIEPQKSLPPLPPSLSCPWSKQSYLTPRAKQAAPLASVRWRSLIYCLRLKGSSDNAGFWWPVWKHAHTQPSSESASGFAGASSKSRRLGFQWDMTTAWEPAWKNWLDAIFKCGNGFEDDFIKRRPCRIFIFHCLVIPWEAMWSQAFNILSWGCENPGLPGWFPSPVGGHIQRVDSFGRDGVGVKRMPCCSKEDRVASLLDFSAQSASFPSSQDWTITHWLNYLMIT